MKIHKNESFQSWLSLLKFSGMVTFTTTCPKTIHRISASSTKANAVLQCMEEKNTAWQPTDLLTLSSSIVQAGSFWMPAHKSGHPIIGSQDKDPRYTIKATKWLLIYRSSALGEMSQDEALWPSRKPREVNLRGVYRMPRERKYTDA